MNQNKLSTTNRYRRSIPLASDANKLCCPVCENIDWRKKQSVRYASISQCINCGLLATTDFLSGNKCTNSLYDVTPVNYAIYCKQYLKNRLISYKRELSRLGKFYSTGRLLEVGSGYGFFLEMASHAGWNAQGVEISNYACEVAKSRGCIVYNGDIKHAHFPMESFDVIVMWDVIEHFTSPAEIIQYCLSLLRPNGALVLKTPNALALSPSPFSPIRTIYRHFVYPANTAEHAFHFTPESLSAMICKRCIEHKNININTERGEWSERVIAGSSFLVRGIRWMIMKYAYIQRWPYEFVITSIKG